MTCRVCGSDPSATIHQPEPEPRCKFPDEHHEFVQAAPEDEA